MPGASPQSQRRILREQVRQELAAKKQAELSAASTPASEQRTSSTDALRLGDFANEADIVELLVNGNMSWDVAVEKGPMFTSSAQKLLDSGYSPETPASAYWVPGRIEVVGKVGHGPYSLCFPAQADRVNCTAHGLRRRS